MYKVGDEVLIKGEVVEVAKDVAYPIEVRLRRSTVPMLFTEEELELSTKTYEMGLSDAWELAKKIVLPKTEGGFSYEETREIFGVGDYIINLKKFTAEEALAKIEAYEKEKEIKVKTIVETNDGSHKGVVTRVRDKGDFFVLWDNGTSDTYEKHEVKNTGKTAESLDLLLRQIGE